MTSTKTLIITFLSLFAVFLLPLTSVSKDFSCKVNVINDGDTITCKDGTKIRLWGINAPEIPPLVKRAEKGGYEAKEFLKKLILNKEIDCKNINYSSTRIVGQCFLINDDISKIMIQNKHAVELKNITKGYYSK